MSDESQIVVLLKQLIGLVVAGFSGQPLPDSGAEPGYDGGDVEVGNDPLPPIPGNPGNGEPTNPDDPGYIPGPNDTTGDPVVDPPVPPDPYVPPVVPPDPYVPPVVPPGGGSGGTGSGSGGSSGGNWTWTGLPDSAPPTGAGFLPLSTLNEPIVGAGGRSIHFTGTAAELKTTIAGLRPGDTLYLPNNGVYKGWFHLPQQPQGSPLIVIRSETIPTGRPGRTATLATFVNESSPVKTIIDSKGANGYSIVGVAFKALTGFCYSALEIGDSDATAIATQPDNFNVFRCLFLGHPSSGMRRAISLHGKRCRIVSNYIGDCWDPNSSDAQAIWGGGGPGPYLIQDNYLSASTEIMLFGGFGPKIPNMIASNVIVYRNEFEKPLTWRSNPNHRSFKNIFEAKCLKDAWIVENVLHGSWVGNQGGEAFVLTARGQGKKCMWARVENIYIARNRCFDIGAGVNMLGRDYSSNYVPYLRNVTIEENIFTITKTMGNLAFGFQILTGCEDVTIRRNTVKGCKVGVFADTPHGPGNTKPSDPAFVSPYPNKRVVITGNVIDGAFSGTGVASGAQVLQKYFVGGSVTGNSAPGGWPSGNTLPSTGLGAPATKVP